MRRPSEQPGDAQGHWEANVLGERLSRGRTARRPSCLREREGGGIHLFRSVDCCPVSNTRKCPHAGEPTLTGNIR